MNSKTLSLLAVALLAAGALAGCADNTSDANDMDDTPTPAASNPAMTPAGSTPASSVPAASPATTPASTPVAMTPAWAPARTSASLTGTGATFPAPLLQKWGSEYNTLTGAQVNYQGVGSSGGVKAITDKTVDFAASDAPLTASQRANLTGVLHIPETMGAVVPAYNVEGVSNLKLDGATLANIFLGTITKWNDPAIAALNPGVSLPDATIVTVHRSDGSGTTNVFTDYLNKVSPEWRAGPGRGNSVNWPGGQAGKGNDGVAAIIAQEPNSIGYVELAYAKLNNMKVAQLKNKAGNYVTASLETTTSAIASIVPNLPAADADWKDVSATDSAGADAWPISSLTYILVYKDLSGAYGNAMTMEEAKALLDFLWWIVHDGQKYSTALDYAPLPAEAVELNEDGLRSITYNGQPVFTA